MNETMLQMSFSSRSLFTYDFVLCINTQQLVPLHVKFGGVKSNDELEAPDATPQSPRQAPPSPDYIPSPEHPPSPDYVLGPKEPEQPLPDDASLTALSPGYVTDYNPEEDPEEDLEEDLADGGDDADDESSDDDDDDEEQEASKDDDEEEEEHPAMTDSSVVPVDDPFPLAKDTEAF
ncbi:hypothetical protein Tco_0499149 [Tanacetum coccineum]